MKRANISQVDALFSNGRYPIEFLFYYRQAVSLKSLRLALRKISSLFWPVFSDYRNGLISFDDYHEDDFYAEEDVRQMLSVSEIQENPSEVRSRFRRPDLKKLFFLKVVRFENGMALIPKLSHMAGDGYSYFFFLSRLALATRRARVPLPSSWAGFFMKPRHRRTILKDFLFQGVQSEPVVQNEHFTVEFDEISRDEVKSMIEHIASVDRVRVSTNDVLTAMAVKKLAGKQGEHSDEPYHLTMPIDVRRQIKEYGPRFFGNGLLFHTVKFNGQKLESSATREIALDIRRSMPAISKEAYINYLEALEGTIIQKKTDKLRPFDPSRGCLVTNLSKLPTDQLDFGTGRPELIIPLSIEKNSTALLAKGGSFVLRYAY